MFSLKNVFGSLFKKSEPVAEETAATAETKEIVLENDVETTEPESEPEAVHALVIRVGAVANGEEHTPIDDLYNYAKLVWDDGVEARDRILPLDSPLLSKDENGYHIIAKCLCKSPDSFFEPVVAGDANWYTTVSSSTQPSDDEDYPYCRYVHFDFASEGIENLIKDNKVLVGDFALVFNI